MSDNTYTFDSLIPILLSCGENAASTIVIDQLSGGTLGASTGHAFLIYNSYVNDTLDLSGYNFGYSVDPETGSFPLDIQKGKDDSPNAAYGLLVGGAISMSAGGTTVDDARCAVYNLEFVKHARGVSYSPNAYLVNKVTQTELDALLQAFEGESKKSYEAVGYNCTDVSLNVWNQIFGTDLNTKGVLHLVNIHTPRGLKCQIEDMKEGQVNLNLDEFVQ